MNKKTEKEINKIKERTCFEGTTKHKTIKKIKGRHYCIIPKKTKIVKDGEESRYGTAISLCFEDSDGLLWADNNEYRNQVNFCPFCSYEAKIKIK